MKRLLMMLAMLAALGASADEAEKPFAFTTFYATWTGNGEAWLLPYVQAARPEVTQVCFFGPMFHAYADEAKSTGYPMQLPVAGQVAAWEHQKATIAALKEAGTKVVVHFQLTNVIDADGQAEGLWSSLLTERWPVALLGPKPELPPDAYLQRDAEGQPLRRKHYHITYVGLCITNPATLELQKRFLKLALDSGADGIVANYNYYWGCVCDHCQASFKAWLRENCTAAELAAMGIDDLAAHRFAAIPAAVPGYPAEPTPLALAAERWAAVAFKAYYDALMIDYGRRVKPGLILGAWNHLGYLGVGEERAFLPLELWGKGEDFFWYSGGYGPTKLAEGKLGDGWLDSLYIRELGGGKPFVMGKYEAVRLRNSLAEGLATGGAGTGLGFNMGDAIAFEVGVAYTRFVLDHQPLYTARTPVTEIGLLLPRQALMAGRREAMDAFKAAGEALSRDHRLIDVIVDERLSAERLAGYRVLVVPLPAALSEAQRGMIAGWVTAGGQLLVVGDGPLLAANGRDEAAWIEGTQRRQLAAEALPEALAAIPDLSRIAAPTTVRVAAWRVPDGLALHLVNYDRDEAAAPKPRGVPDEHPRPTGAITVELSLPQGQRAKEVWLLSPDAAAPLKLAAEQAPNQPRLRVAVPDMLVYSVVKVVLEPR